MLVTDWMNDNPGVGRRKKILEYLRLEGRFNVNCRNRPQMWQDKDLTYLLKKGKIRVVREGRLSWSWSPFRVSYVELVEEV